MSGTEALISIDTEAELEKIIQQLNRIPDQIAAPKILQKALNDTARKVRKQMVMDAKCAYAIKNKAALKDASNGAPKVLTASTADLSAAIQSKGPMQEIMTFMTKPNTKTGAAAARVLSSNSMKPLEKGGLKAFVTQFASGHVAIVQRKGKARLPVKKLLSPSVPHMLGNETVREQALALTYETLQGEIEKQIQRVLNRA